MKSLGKVLEYPFREPMPSETISLRLFKLFLVSEDVFESQDFYLA